MFQGQNAEFKYFLADDAEGTFDIDSDTGMITVAADQNLDRETTHQYILKVSESSKEERDENHCFNEHQRGCFLSVKLIVRCFSAFESNNMLRSEGKLCQIISLIT